MRCRIAALASLAVLIFSAVAQPPRPEVRPDIPVKGEAPKRDEPDGPGIFGQAARPPAPAKVGADGFTIHLDTEFALENGPVVYRIRLVNQLAEPRDCFRHTHYSPVRFTRKPDWIRKPQPNFRSENINGQYGPFREQVEGGNAATQLIAVQAWYQRIPPGCVTVEFEWDVVGAENRSWHTTKRSWGVQDAHNGHGDSREPVRGRQIIEVERATPENIARAKEKLEKYLREVRTGARRVREVIRSLVGSHHPEFVPLMIGAIQMCQDYECRDLLDTVYDSFPDPSTGFEKLFPLLESGDPASHYLLDYWEVQVIRYSRHLIDIANLSNLKAGHREVYDGHDLTTHSWDRVENALQVWNYSRPHSNSRLTLDQHARIQALGNVWVRAMYWQRFPEWCSPYWVIRLYADLKRTIVPLEGKAIEAICKGLAHDRFPVRERAMADAMKMDERVVPALRDYYKRHPTAELEQRIGIIARHFEQQTVLPIAARVIESAMYSGSLHGELIFQALTGPAGSSRLADSVREKRPEQEKRRQEELERQAKHKRLEEAKK